MLQTQNGRPDVKQVTLLTSEDSGILFPKDSISGKTYGNHDLLKDYSKTYSFIVEWQMTTMDQFDIDKPNF